MTTTDEKDIPMVKGDLEVAEIKETLAVLRRHLAQEYDGDSIVDVSVLQCQMLLHLYDKLESIEARRSGNQFIDAIKRVNSKLSSVMAKVMHD